MPCSEFSVLDVPCSAYPAIASPAQLYIYIIYLYICKRAKKKLGMQKYCLSAKTKSAGARKREGRAQNLKSKKEWQARVGLPRSEKAEARRPKKENHA
jgi:hypothetical protein